MADGHAGDTERLHEYWVHGEGAAKIRWGEPGDFQRCVDHLGKYIADPQGYCNLAHHAALGIYPATHAKEIEGRSAGMAQTKAPYGDVPYGDPGYLDADGNQASKSGKPGVKRYPLSADKVMAAWSYINQAKNAGQYTPEQLSSIKGKIKAAMAKHGHDVSDSDSDDSAGRSVPREQEWRFTPGVVEVRALDDGKQRIGGYGAVFGKLSRPIAGFVEKVTPGAFNQSKQLGWPGVVCRLNHDKNQLLGTAEARTLTLRTDKIGLDYEVEPPQFRSDIVELVARGDIRNSSFAFHCPRGGDEWRTTDQGYPLRILHEVQLLDVAPVTGDEAYTDSTVGLRSLAAAMDAPFEEVRSLADADELRKFFVRTDNRGPAPAAPLLSGPQAMMRLMEKRYGPADPE